VQLLSRSTRSRRLWGRDESAIAGNPVASKASTPPFITATGPTREARFPFFFNANGSVNTSNPNGGVEDLFTVSGRSDAGSCSLRQPSFQAAIAANNIIFRIPTPTSGAGLIENLDDSTFLATRQRKLNNNFGVSGTFNHNGNDGTISRFGWKAQNKSLLLFAGEAYNVEMGISNQVFAQDRPLPDEDGNGGSNGSSARPALEETVEPTVLGPRSNNLRLNFSLRKLLSEKASELKRRWLTAPTFSITRARIWRHPRVNVED